MNEVVRLKGHGVAEGVGRGPLRRYEARVVRPRRVRAAPRPTEEIRRFHLALERAREELSRAPRRKETEALIKAHLMILEDPILIAEVERYIRKPRDVSGGTAEVALEGAIEYFARIFEEKKDPMFAERAADLRDAGMRVLSQLTGEKVEPPEDGVIVALDLPPSVLLEAKRPERLQGIVLESGGATSHIVILARAYGIPVVIGVEDLMKHAKEGMEVELDGTTGRVELYPAGARPPAPAPVRRRRAEPFAPVETKTADGVRVCLRANIQVPVEVALAREVGAEGIGLYRTEYLLMLRRNVPAKEITRRITDALTAFPDHPVTVRTSDIGGDKFGGASHLDLGLRAIRLSLANPDRFRRELMAILEAREAPGRKGELRLMLPMVTTVEEVEETRRILDDLSEYSVPLGIMVETPAAALTLDLFAGKIDFASIGTNDLAQYALAAARSDDRLTDYLGTSHPAVWRLIAEAVARARAAGIPLAVCGEMAGEAEAAGRLVGLGVRELSVTPRRIPALRKALEELRVADAEKDARAALRRG